MEIRKAVADDLYAIEQIYAHYVGTSMATFEETSERSTDFHQLYDKQQELQLPFLVAVDRSDNRVAGYAYASPYHARTACRFTVENSIYLRPDAAGRGLGRQLLKALIDALRDTPIKQVVAAMSIMPDVQDDDVATCRLHRSFGFTSAGMLRAVGFKFGTWVDVVYYQLNLALNLKS